MRLNFHLNFLRHFLTLGAALISFFNVDFAYAEITNVYTVREAADASKSCAQQANALATRLATVLKVEVRTEPKCVDVSFKDHGAQYPLRTLVVSYVVGRDSAYGSFYQANYSTNIVGSELNGMTGIYPSYASCLSEIEKRKLEFTQQTGLLPISAGCYPEALGLNGTADPKFTLRVDGFGRPSKYLRLLAISRVQSGANRKDLISESAQLLSQVGATAVAQVEEGILYYSALNFFSQEGEIGFLNNPAECEAQAQTLENLMQKNSLKAGPARCQKVDFLGKTYYNLRALGIGQTVVSSGAYSNQSYYSFEECLAVAYSRNQTSQQTRSASFCRNVTRDLTNTYANPSFEVFDLIFM